jgi:uncharacterized membrane protein
MVEVERRDLERLVNLTDAALAITLTLMMLEIRLPTSAAGMSDSTLLSALGELLPRLYAYALSFVVVGIFWSSHRQKFRHLIRADAVVVWLDIAFLLILGLVPFVTGLIAENGGRVATIAYAAVMAGLSVILLILWSYAIAAGLIDASTPVASRRRGFWISGYAIVVFSLSIAVALYNADNAKYLWLLLLLSRPLGRVFVPVPKPDHAESRGGTSIVT